MFLSVCLSVCLSIPLSCYYLCASYHYRNAFIHQQLFSLRHGRVGSTDSTVVIQVPVPPAPLSAAKRVRWRTWWMDVSQSLPPSHLPLTPNLSTHPPPSLTPIAFSLCPLISTTRKRWKPRRPFPHHEMGTSHYHPRRLGPLARLESRQSQKTALYLQVFIEVGAGQFALPFGRRIVKWQLQTASVPGPQYGVDEGWRRVLSAGQGENGRRSAKHRGESVIGAFSQLLFFTTCSASGKRCVKNAAILWRRSTSKTVRQYSSVS